MPEAPPELQQQYDDVAARSLMFLYKPEVFSRVVEMIETGDDPQEALAETAAMLFGRVDAAMRESGREFDPQVKLAAAAEVMGNLGEIASEIGTHDFVGDKKALEGAWYLALDRVRAAEEAGGLIDPQQAQQDAAAVAQMDQDGTLERVLAEAGGAPREAQRGLMPGGMA